MTLFEKKNYSKSYHLTLYCSYNKIHENSIKQCEYADVILFNCAVLCWLNHWLYWQKACKNRFPLFELYSMSVDGNIEDYTSSFDMHDSDNCRHARSPTYCLFIPSQVVNTTARNLTGLQKDYCTWQGATCLISLDKLLLTLKCASTIEFLFAIHI